MSFKIYIVGLLVFLLSGLAQAQILLVPLRGQDQVLCEKLKKITGESECYSISAQTKEFDNGNTFVQFESEVRGRTIALVIDREVGPNQIMEVLIKVRTAKTMGAKSARVFLSGDVDPSFINLLTVAGADRVFNFSGDQIVEEYAKNENEKIYGPEWGGKREIIVYSENHRSLAQELSREFGVGTESVFSKLLDRIERLNGKVEVIFVEAGAPDVNERILDSVAKVRELKKTGALVHLMTPYFPYSRSDKVDQFGVAVTGRLIADLIEDAGVATMIFARLHAPQAQGFFRIPTIHITGRETVAEYLRPLDIDAVISPDAGFQKEATLYAGLLEKPVYVLNKQRDPKTGLSKMKKMGSFNLKGKTVAIIDDETASGGTLGEAAAFLKANGAARVIAIVTHLAGSAKKALESNDLDELVVMNTLPIRAENVPKLKVLSIGEETAKALQALVSEISCTSLLTGDK